MAFDSCSVRTLRALRPLTPNQGSVRDLYVRKAYNLAKKQAHSGAIDISVNNLIR